MSRNKPQVTRPQKPKEVQQTDLFETPNYAIKPMLPYLKDKLLWEPAMGSGRIVDYLLSQGLEIYGTDLKRGENFFEYEFGGYQAIVTNPPYSIKYQWIKRCYELGKPFALLVPLETIGSSNIQTLLKQYGFEMMLLDSRVDFHTPNKGWQGSGAQFPVIWLTWKLLDSPIVFASIKEDKAAFKKHLKGNLNA